MARPFVKWVGGKKKLEEEIVSEFPVEFKTYYEGFTGGGAIFFGLKPKRAVLNDFNLDLVSCYKLIKSNPNELMTRLEELSNLDEKLRKETFLRIRKETPTSEIDRAVRLLFLNKNCYNGLYRVNKKGQFNVPFGSYKTPPSLFDRENILECSEALADVSILNEDFETACSTAVEGDLVYLDPPYVPLNVTSSFASYTTEGFKKKDQERLAAFVGTLYDRGVSVVVSNSDTPIVHNLYSRFPIKIIQAARSVNSKGSQRGKIPEVLVVAVHKR